MLSVSGKPETHQTGFARVAKALALALSLFLAISGKGTALASDYGSYEDAGAPELNKLVWNARAGTYGVWTAPSRYAYAKTQRLEADCAECAVATAPRARRSQAKELKDAGREIKKVAGAQKKAAPKKAATKKAAPRTAEVEAEEESEYAAIKEEKTIPEDKPSQAKAPGKFVETLLKHAYTEANRTMRMTSKGVRYKGSLGEGMGMCLQGVRIALQKTKGVSTGRNIGTDLAKNAGPHLKKFGYIKAGGKISQDNAPIGSIMIYDAPGQPRKAGHIEIKGRNGYYSDYFNSRPVNQLMPGRRRLIGIYLPPQN